MTDVKELVERYDRLVSTATSYAKQELNGAPTSIFEIQVGHFRDFGRDLTTALEAMERQNARLQIDASNHAADAETVRRERDAAEAQVATLTEKVARMGAALRGDWHGVFLDGRNEHGSHVLNLPQCSITLEQDSEGYFLREDAEAILLDAESKGFRSGDHAVVVTFDRCTDDGRFSHYEVAEVCPVLTALFYGTPEEQDAVVARAALENKP